MADESAKPSQPVRSIMRPYDAAVLKTSRECLSRSREVLDETEPMVRGIHRAEPDR